MPKASNIRPTTDKLRSAIFSILSDKIVGSYFLDVFSGSGAVGIEALSRGAYYVQFIDIDIEAIECNKPLVNGKKIDIIKKDFFKLSKLNDTIYDIVFIDPPYGAYDSGLVLHKIIDTFCLKDDSIIIYEEHYKNKFKCINGYSIYDERKFGDTIIRFLRSK